MTFAIIGVKLRTYLVESAWFILLVVIQGGVVTVGLWDVNQKTWWGEGVQDCKKHLWFSAVMAILKEDLHISVLISLSIPTDSGARFESCGRRFTHASNPWR